MPNKLTVLLVDDHALVRRGFRRILEDEPSFHVVGEASDGLEAVQLAEQLPPAVIVMDCALPQINGIEATRTIRGFAPDMKIIGVSVQAERSYVNEMLRNGANGYVTKNSSSTEMITAIDEVLAGNTYICEEVRHLRTHQNSDLQGHEHN